MRYQPQNGERRRLAGLAGLVTGAPGNFVPRIEIIGTRHKE